MANPSGSASETGPFGLDVDLGPNGKFSFKSPEAIENWVSTEERFWSWARFPDQEARIVAPLRQARHLLAQARQMQGAPEVWEPLRDHLARAFGSSVYLHSARPEATFLKALEQDEGSAIASIAAVRLMGLSNYPQTNALVTALGVARATLWQAGVQDVESHERKALEALRNEMQQELDRARTTSRNAAAEAAASIDDASAQLAALREDVEKRLGEMHNAAGQRAANLEIAFAKMTSEAEGDLKALTDTYDKHMALASSVAYWTDTRNFHRVASWAWFGVAFAVGIGGLFTLAEATSWLLTTPQPNEWKIALGVLFLTAYIWVVRIFSKLFWTSIHLRLDADERIVLVKSYLALSREGNLTGEKDRALILSVLFRRASTGILKDDASPGTLIDLLSRGLFGK